MFYRYWTLKEAVCKASHARLSARSLRAWRLGLPGARAKLKLDALSSFACH
jgi:hypothetical protein